MTDTFTTLLRLTQIADQGNNNTWGTILNSGVIELLDEAIAGYVNVDVTFGDVTLTEREGLPDQSRPMMLRVTGTPGVTRTITLPDASKVYVVGNLTSSKIRLKISGGSTTTELDPTDTPTLVYADATDNVVRLFNHTDVIGTGDQDWNTFTCDVTSATSGDTEVEVKYAKQGGLVTLIVPAHNVTVNAATWILVPQGGGGMPSAIQHSGQAVDEFVTDVTINSGGTEVPAFLRVNSGTGNLQFYGSEVGGSGASSFGIGVDRDLPAPVRVIYSVY